MTDINTAFHTTDAPTRAKRLALVRQMLAEHGLSALIVPSSDPHMSEYLPTHWQGRAWLSGFTGSVGTLVITADMAGLWTDSRYWVQAPMQLDGTGIKLYKMAQGKPTYAQFLANHLPEGAKVAIDGAVLSMTEHTSLIGTLASKNITLATKSDLLANIWHDRPALPTNPIYPHHATFRDLSISEKLVQIRQSMREKGADYHLISSLDDVAYLTNLRGADVSFNPVFLAHLLIGAERATLFVGTDKLSDDALALLNEANIDTCPYDEICVALSKLTGTLLIDPAKVAIGTLSQLPNTVATLSATNPSTLLKAIKTPKELAHIKDTMRADGVALCEFFADFEERLAKGERLSELDVDELLTTARASQPHYVSPSFDTIAGFGGNGAIVHYRATHEYFSHLDGDGLLLIDSGGQYQNGTTDITRMVGIGNITDEQKQDITYVLKAHIALATAHFPNGISSPLLDVLARNQLWQVGRDYGHGTGHGVGYFMNVHEAPQVISYTAPATPERAMRVGMISSNEPGLYREGKWGIRLENLVACVPASTSEFGDFLTFENLTLCPFDTRLLLTELLTQQEKAWLNDYHQQVHDELIDLVDGKAKTWLIERTKPIK